MQSDILKYRFSEQLVDSVGQNNLPFNIRITQKNTKTFGKIFLLTMDKFDLISKNAHKNWFTFGCETKEPLLQLIQDKVIPAYQRQIKKLEELCKTT